MRSLVDQFRAERAYKKSVQQMMDEKMCRPGYRWSGEPLNKCLPAVAYIPRDRPSLPDRPPSDPPQPPTEGTPAIPPPETQPTPDQAIAAEAAKRQKRK